MKLFISDNTDKSEKIISATYNYRSLIVAAEARIFKGIVDDLAKRITDEIYPHIVKEIDKELIVKEVALKVSENVIEKLFSGKESKDV